MKKLLLFIALIATFALSADVRPFVFADVADEQVQYEYMLQYKLYGRDYLKIGQNDTIPDKSGWNGSATTITLNHQVVLGGPILTPGTFSVGNGANLVSGPVRAQTFTMQNNNGNVYKGNYCIENGVTQQIQNIIANSGGAVSCDNVPDAPVGLSMPTLIWPDTITQNIVVNDRGKKYIDIPDVETYDLYVNSITTGTEDTLFIRMRDGGTLTRIFVNGSISFGNHTVVQVVYRTDEGDVVQSQDQYRGNLMFYTNQDFNIRNTDYSKLQGTYITTAKINLISNIDFAGQLLANQLEIGDNFSGKNFRFVKFDPDTLDFNPELNKNGGLRENDSTVIIPIQLSDTATNAVTFTYCFDLKDGITVEDFNTDATEFPICGVSTKTVVIPVGSKTPTDTIKINVKKDDISEPNDSLAIKIHIEEGAILPNGKFDGELKIKIVDAEVNGLAFDTTKTYSVAENYVGKVDDIAIFGKTDTTTFTLDSAAHGIYTLNATTGELALTTPLDYETVPIDTIKVTIKDGSTSITRYIPIAVEDVNEAPTLNDTTITLSENIPIPSIVGTLKANDPDAKSEFKQNWFELIAGDANFAVDKTTGRITATKIFDYETDATTYTLVVRVYDKTDPTLTDTATVTIKISDTNEGPKFATEDTTFFIAENTTPGVIGSIPAIDQDGDAITYSIVGNVPFTVDANGNISSTREFDYEKETGFTFKLVATDGTLSDTVKVNVKVTNVNEECTVNDTVFTINENATGKLGNVNATDKDKDALFGTISYDISDPTTYQIDKDGNIFVKVTFNYEDKTVDSIKVFITDGTFKDTATVVINIANVQEPITVTGIVNAVDENSELGTPIGAITGVDGDSTAVTYTINTTDFKIDPVTGVITTNSVIDYETQSEYPVTVTAKSTDGSTKDTSFVITVNNINEPVHAKDTTFAVNENTTGELGKVTGEDEDGKPVKFSCDDTVHYSIDPNTGVIRLVEPFDFETTTADTVLVFVTDGTFTDTAVVAIKVNNVNEDPKLQPNDSLTVPENCKSCIIGIITATDPDNDPIIYEVVEPGFSIDSNGVLKLTEPVDYETTPTVTVTVIAKDTAGAADTAMYVINVSDINEPVHVNDTTCSVKENYTGEVCKIIATDEDKTKPKYIVTDTTNYSIDSTGTLIIKNPIDFEKKDKDTVTVIVTDGEFFDTAQVIINVLDEIEQVEITKFDDKPKQDTIKTNNPDHTFEWKICEDVDCKTTIEYPKIHKDTVIKVCNDKKTVCDSVTVLFNDAPPVVLLTNAKSTDALIDYITIEEIADDKIYVNKKDNDLLVTVKDTVSKTTKTFPINVALDTIHVSTKNVVEYNFVIDETKATVKPIGGGLAELTEVINDNGTEVTITKIVKVGSLEPVDTVQTVSYQKKQDGKTITVTYQTDNATGQRLTDYSVSYDVDSCTTISYNLGDNKKIVKNEEGNIAYTITYAYEDDFGNKASASVEVVFDNIPPKVEILSPYEKDVFKTNAIAVEWTVNGVKQDTLTLQRLEQGVNYVIRRYVDKAGNVSADTVVVIMKEAKDIDVKLVYPVTEIDQDKVDSFYQAGNKYNPDKPYTITTLKGDEKPNPVGVGLQVDIALPSVSPTGGLATLDDIVKNGMIPVDDKGNIVGASTKGIPVDKYVEEHCTEEFKQDYKKNGLNIPLYDVQYNMHLWIYTTQANYVNDFNISYTLNDEDEATSAGTVTMVVDYLSDRDGHVKASNGHGLGTGAYITKLYSKSIAKHRCDYKEQRKGERTVKKEDTFTTFGYKRPNSKK